MWPHLWAWLAGQVWPNIFASGVCVAIGYFWSIRPHMKRQSLHREQVSLHHKRVEDRLEDLYRKINSQEDDAPDR